MDFTGNALDPEPESLEQLEPHPDSPEELMIDALSEVDIFLRQMEAKGFQTLIAFRYEDPISKREWVRMKSKAPRTICLGLIERLREVSMVHR